MKIVVLGGGHCQLNMIKRLKDEDHHVILVDYLPDCPGLSYADEHYMTSTFDYGKVSEIVRRAGARAIITMGTDQPVLTTAIAARENGIPFYIDPETAVKVTNKKVMKEIFKSYDIPTQPFAFIGVDFKDSEIAGIGFPAVLKPVDSQGQRGIFKVDSIEEIRKNIKETLRYSREARVLLEEYYPNDEITVNGWAVEGKAHIISVVDRVTMDNGNRIGICIAHNHPSKHLAANAKDIMSITQRIVDSFEIEDGPLYFQYLIGAKGIRVNEIAMRIGGAYEDITIPLINGIDILGMICDAVMGKRVDDQWTGSYDFTKDGRFVSTQMFFLEKGEIESFTPVERFMELPYIEGAYYNFKKGTIYAGIENATARAGYFIVSGTSFDDMLTNVDKAYDNLEIIDTHGNKILKKYKDYPNKYLF
ncbi:MAG: ATP-grasp domain-containing protein [Clostridia bacterium]|nr:ATP-grasp domain-containing protein [Clostridia bacterium]